MQYQRADREDQHSGFSFFFTPRQSLSPLFCLSPLGGPVLESGEVEEEEEHDEELRHRVVRKLGAMDTRVHPCVPKLVNAHSSCNPTSFTPSFGTHFPFHVTASPVPAAPSSSSSSSSSSLFFFTNSSVFSTTAAASLSLALCFFIFCRKLSKI